MCETYNDQWSGKLCHIDFFKWPQDTKNKGKIAHNNDLCQMIYHHTAEHYWMKIHITVKHENSWCLKREDMECGFENDTGWWDWTKIENGSTQLDECMSVWIIRP